MTTMHSIYSQLLIAMQEHIKEQIPAIQWCDQWWGQEQFEYRPAVAFPALLIDFPSTNFSAEGDGSLFATINISLRLLFAPFSSSASTAPIEARQEALQYYEIEHLIIEAMHCWQPPIPCQSLTLTGITTENRNPEYRVRNLTFSTAFELDINM